MRSSPALLVALVAILCCSQAFPAGPFDGQWVGGAPRSSGGGCYLFPTTVTLKIVDGVVTGTSSWGGGANSVTGSVTPQGKFTGKSGDPGDGPFEGEVNGDEFSYTYVSSAGRGCYRKVTLHRQ